MRRRGARDAAAPEESQYCRTVRLSFYFERPPARDEWRWHSDALTSRRTAEQDSEMMRLQLLGDPAVMHQLREVRMTIIYLTSWVPTYRQTNPELAAAAQNNPVRFAELLRQTRARHVEAERELNALEADPYDIEAQRRIEEAIRQQAIMENLEHALEYSPEAFGRVTML